MSRRRLRAGNGLCAAAVGARDGRRGGHEADDDGPQRANRLAGGWGGAEGCTGVAELARQAHDRKGASVPGGLQGTRECEGVTAGSRGGMSWSLGQVFDEVDKTTVVSVHSCSP